MSFLQFNGTTQYLDFVETISPVTISSVSVVFDNPADASKIFDTNLGDINVVDNVLTLSNLTGPIKRIGTNQTDGTFYSGGISNFILNNPAGNTRFFTPTEGNNPNSLNGILASSFTLIPPLTIQFDLDYTDVLAFPISTTFDFIRDSSFGHIIRGIQTTNHIEIQRNGILVSAEMPNSPRVYTVRFEVQATASQLYFDDVLQDSQTHANKADFDVEFIFDPSNAFGWIMSNILFKDGTQEFFYPIDEGSGTLFTGTNSAPNGTWNIDSTRTGNDPLSENNSNFNLNEGEGNIVSNVGATQTATIIDFNEDMWQGILIPGDGVTKKIRQSLFVLES